LKFLVNRRISMRLSKSLAIVILALLLNGIAGTAAISSDAAALPNPSMPAAIKALSAAVADAEAGRIDDAVEKARAIYFGNGPDAVRLRSALLVSDLQARSGRFLSAKLWLRRAFDLASDAESRNAIAMLHRQVAAASPIAASAQLSFAPSSNVNNGGKTNIIVIGGFPFVFGGSSLELAGIEATGSFSLTYRLGQTPLSRTEAFADAGFRKVWLDPSAAEIAPDVSNSDFDQINLSAGLRHSWQAFLAMGPTSFSASAGGSFLAGERLSSWTSLDFGQIVNQSPTHQLRVEYQIRSEDRFDAEINGSLSRRIGGIYQRRLAGGTELTVQLAGSDVSSESALIEKDELAAGVSIAGLRIGPFAVTLGLDAAVADYSKWILTAGGRRDISLGARLEATYGQISILGFSPSASLTARKTDSNVDIFDRETLTIGLSLKSNF